MNWKEDVRKGLASGFYASMLSVTMLIARGRREVGSVHAATNATSHWAWGDVAGRRNLFSPKYTLTGYAIHHVCSTFCAVLHEAVLARMLISAKKSGREDIADTPSASKSPPIAIPLATATAVTAFACFADYRLTPPRLRPGYEMRLSRKSMAAVYVASGAGLFLAATVARRTRPAKPS